MVPKFVYIAACFRAIVRMTSKLLYRMIEENEFLEIERHPDGVPLPEVFLGRMEVCIDLISRGVPAQHACAASGVRRKDFDYVLKHHEILSNRIANARFQAVESLKNEIANAGKLQKRKRTINHSNGAVTTIEDEIVGDWKASAWLLERFDRDNFGPTAGHVTVNVDVSAMIQETVKEIASRNARIDAVDAEFTEIVTEETQDGEK